jgi:signal transduction histidine kinase
MSATNFSREATEAPRADSATRRFGRRLAGVFLVIAAMLAVAAWVYLSHQQAEARAEAHRELSAIADLKLKQIHDWREERLSDARFFARARFVAQDVRRFLDEPNSEAARAAVLHWMDLLKSGDRYFAVMVFDMRLERRLALPASAGVPPASIRNLLEAAVQGREVAISDLQRDETNGLVHLNIAFPVFEGADAKQGVPLALVLLELDARRFLFPLINSWPTPSRTAETLLVRREGNEVLFLNDLRHRPGTALALRLPLTSRNLPAARVLAGETNVLEGVDYRGVPVVAAGHSIPGTPWAMVAKVDREEIYSPLRQQMLAALCVLGALLLAGALLVALLWRQRSGLFLERELAERKAHQSEMERAAEALREARDALARANEDLERQVHERTVQLVEANANLQTFSYTAAHDLRSPLRSIKSFSEIVVEDHGASLGAEGRSMLARISASADQLARLLENLLEYSRMSQAELTLQPVSLSKAVREVLALLHGDIRAKNAIVTAADPLPEVIGHAATVVLLITNLVSNALKFIASDVQPQVRIWAERNGSCVRLYVQDNGIGIAPRDQEKIFGPFQRLQSKQAYPGTGLGLAIVRKGVERMGGQTGVESEAGKGSRFWVEFKAAEQTVEP